MKPLRKSPGNSASPVTSFMTPSSRNPTKRMIWVSPAPGMAWMAAQPLGMESKAVPGAGLTQIILFVGFLELGVMKDATGEAEFPGDFRNGFIDFGWDTFDEETKLQKRGVELNNGRAAMMGILGLMVHEQLGGSVPIVGEL